MSEQRKFVTHDPENSETPLQTVSSWVTPTRLFFVRNHFGIPHCDSAAWRLRLCGCVDREIELSLLDLEKMPQRSVAATIECAGNGRSFLNPSVHGVQWGAGAIGHAEWEGVPLAEILKRTGIRPGAVELVFEGADSGTESDHPEPMPFARSLPLEKALDRDTLLALRMNGEPLEASHGAPLRLLVPGWYGVASVKWLTRIDVVDRPFRGYYQTRKYTIQRETDDDLETVAVGEMAIKSEIIRPAEGAVLSPGTQRMFGVAWSGEQPVAGVGVSTDGGRNWHDADLIGPQATYSWTMWEYLWEVAVAGDYTLMASARSAGGMTQPHGHDRLLGGYLINFCRGREVRVEAKAPTYAARATEETLVYDMNAFAEENTRLPLDVEMEFSEGGGI